MLNALRHASPPPRASAAVGLGFNDLKVVVLNVARRAAAFGTGVGAAPQQACLQLAVRESDPDHHEHRAAGALWPDAVKVPLHLRVRPVKHKPPLVARHDGHPR